MSRKLLSVSFAIFLFAISAFAQIDKKNLLEEVEIKFTLEAEPTAQDVGFDDPKSSWKVKYELYLTDFSEMEKLGLVKTDDHNRRYIVPIIRETKLNKRIKTKSIKISKGKFTRKSLSNDAGREVTVPIKLSPEIIEIFNQATKIPERNPTFVIFVTEKILVKNSVTAKLKDKNLLTDFSPLKHSLSNQNFEYWNVKNMSLNAKVVRRDDGKLVFIGGLVH